MLFPFIFLPSTILFTDYKPSHQPYTQYQGNNGSFASKIRSNGFTLHIS
jgi:hypothetical protein